MHLGGAESWCWQGTGLLLCVLQLRNTSTSHSASSCHLLSSQSPISLLPAHVIFQVAASSQPRVYTSEWIIQAGRPVRLHSPHHRNWVTLLRCNSALSQAASDHNFRVHNHVPLKDTVTSLRKSHPTQFCRGDVGWNRGKCCQPR